MPGGRFWPNRTGPPGVTFDTRFAYPNTQQVFLGELRIGDTDRGPSVDAIAYVRLISVWSVLRNLHHGRTSRRDTAQSAYDPSSSLGDTDLPHGLRWSKLARFATAVERTENPLRNSYTFQDSGV